ncbi:ATP-binding protein [Fusobacterium gonidiaformans]|uniref:ATP-binding protein n=1 Tax=Fusobacterium gonidiaformans TaxID=849 RepID=UPI0021C1A18B|nr:ATP-binding protein [Fusobacterium gonidiaformans]
MTTIESKPFNPNIANGFFRAGFIETWGRGIEKICEACSNYGIKIPEYTVYPEDITLKFEALNTAKNAASKIDDNFYLVFDYLNQFPTTKHKNIMEDLNISRRTLERIISLLKEQSYIERIGNNRSGYWKILKKEELPIILFQITLQKKIPTDNKTIVPPGFNP